MGNGGGALASPWKCWKVVFFAENVVYNLSRRSIYASFWENVVSFWGLRPRPPQGSCHWTLLGDFRPSDPLIVHPWKNSCGRPWSLTEQLHSEWAALTCTYTRRRSEHKLWIQTHTHTYTHTERHTDRQTRANITRECWLPRTEAACRICCCCCAAYSAANAVNHSSADTCSLRYGT